MADKTDKKTLTKSKTSGADNAKTAEATGVEVPDAFQLFEPSANLILKNFSEFVWLLGAPFILTILSVLQRMAYHPVQNAPFDTSGPLLSLSLLAVIAGALVTPGVIVLELACAQGKTMRAGEAFRAGLHYFWRMVGLGIVLVLALIIAFCLLIVPFFILLPRVIMSPYFLIDKDMTIFDSIHASNDAYKKYHGVWGIIGVSILVYLPSIIPLIGSIISTCLNLLYQPAFALRYLHYRNLEDGKDPRTPFEREYKPEL